ncbi:amidophosphoribosyltransferase [archaeon]|nr:amidophosphoribosyltransferase [archaeon]
MCGIVGVSDGDSTQVYAGLYALQHRGQDSAGILSYNGNFHLKKNKGHVWESFTKDSLKELSGRKSIGQVRYPTIGTDFERDAQPFFIESPEKMGIVHNGNLANYSELRKEYTLSSWCDVEVLLHMLSKHLKITKDPFISVEETMKEANGAYSALTLLKDGSMIVFRDPNALRPLVHGEGMYASESIALDIIGKKLEGDIKGGECVLINDNHVERKQLIKEQPRYCMFEFVYFSRPDSVLQGKSIYEVRLELGKELAKKFDKTADVVIPVPDTSRAAAFGFSIESGIPYREGIIKNRYVGRTFIMPDQSTRENAVKFKLNTIKSEINGKRVVLVDDSVVRGTTCKNLVNLIRNAGAKEVHFAISCPPIRWPCFYGIDMTQKSELFAANVKDAEKTLAEKIGADSVIYQSIDGLKNAIGLKTLCTACLNGDYPTDVSTLLARQGNGKRPYEGE